MYHPYCCHVSITLPLLYDDLCPYINTDVNTHTFGVRTHIWHAWEDRFPDTAQRVPYISPVWYHPGAWGEGEQGHRRGDGGGGGGGGRGHRRSDGG